MPHMFPRLAVISIALLIWSSAVLPARQTPRLPDAPPAAEGFSPERLARLQARMQEVVDAGDYAGFVWLVARHGRVTDTRAVGFRDREARLPMERDTIFRIYSMTKTVTSVAAMMLVEEGRLRLDDPVGRHLPALTSPLVLTGGTEDRPVLTKPVRSVTIRHLLTHTSGYSYGFARNALDRIYQRGPLLNLPTMAAFVERVASLPLAEDPGRRFRYGINTDILGAVIEQVSGQGLDAFIAERITGPLRMHDTAFVVPATRRQRMARVYTKNDTGTLEPVVSEGVPYPDEDGRTFPSGGGGLFSTVDDYARFAQMLLNGGTLDGVRLLGRKTVESMRSNHLVMLDPPTRDNGADGFGLGVSVRRHVAKRHPARQPRTVRLERRGLYVL
jgi:CubicO group peptidase (beta-lactamase class C family)